MDSYARAHFVLTCANGIYLWVEGELFANGCQHWQAFDGLACLHGEKIPVTRYVFTPPMDDNPRNVLERIVREAPEGAYARLEQHLDVLIIEKGE